MTVCCWREKVLGTCELRFRVLEIFTRPIACLPSTKFIFVLNKNDTAATTDDDSVGSARPKLDLSSLRLQADEDKDKALSDDGLSYEGTVVWGGVRQETR